MKSPTDKLLALRAKMEANIKIIDGALSLLNEPRARQLDLELKKKDGRGRRKWSAAQKKAASEARKKYWADKKKSRT